LPVRILAHGDTDGICAAALVKSKFSDAEVWFARPVSLPRYLAEIEPGATVIICDIAISESQKEYLFKRIRELAQRDEVIYMDHHPLPPETLKKDVPATQFAHEIGVSTSELAFRIFVQDSKSDLDRVALWGAIGDYCEETEFVRDGLSKYDRRTIYMEAGLLSQALGDAAGDYDYKREVVHRLSRGEIPTEIPEIVNRAIKATKKEWETYEYVKKHVVREGNLAIVYDLPSGSLGKAAMHALGVAGTDVGLCTRMDDGEVDISLRRRAGAKIDLNLLLRHITARLGGSGGGHEGAAGATIPAELLPIFIETLRKEIAPVIGREPGVRR